MNYNVLLAIMSAYYDGEYSNFGIKDLLRDFNMSEKVYQTMIKQLLDLNLISNCTTPGYINRFTLNKIIPCPEFIKSTELTNSQKNFLLKCIEQKITKEMSNTEFCIKIYGYKKLYNLKRMVDSIPGGVFKWIDNYNCLSNIIPLDSEKTPLGYLRNKKQGIKALNSLSHKLYEKSNKRAKKSNIEYTLTEEDILNQLEKQNFKDYYTRMELTEENASIDRIDSSIGYIKDNIVITTYTINVMKGEQTIEEFKNNIINLHKNISNF